MQSPATYTLRAKLKSTVFWVTLLLNAHLSLVLAQDEYFLAQIQPGDSTNRNYLNGLEGKLDSGLSELAPDTSVGPLKIAGFYQFLAGENKLTDLTQELISQREITLNYGDKFFRLEFNPSSVSSPIFQYKYKIEGFDEEWQYSSEPVLRISGLPFGEYKLRLAGQNEIGALMTQELVIPVSVVRPFHLTWWFLAMVILVIATFLFFLRKYQIRKLLEAAENKRLKELDLLKSKLYTNITHEFRTPLTVIMGMAEQLAEESGQGEKDAAFNTKDKEALSTNIRDRTRFILRNARQLLSLTNQMLDLSKIESGRLHLQWELGDVVLFLQYISESFHSYASTKDIQLTFYPEVRTLEMDYDREKLQHIISNLLSNAIKFTPKGGKVVFHVGEVVFPAPGDPSMLQIKISNSGDGISADHLPNIFDRFYQVENANNQSNEGTGIGLALAKELVELMGGKISVESEIGQGATFIVMLPVRKSATHNLEKLRIEPALTNAVLRNEELENFGKSEGATMTDDTPLLLLIEDNADVAAYIQECLQGQFSVIWAANGRLGIEKAVESVPDIIISDVIMPEKDGYEVTKFLKNDERTSHIPIILLTAKADIQSRIMGLERGADAYLSKPFVKKELQVRVKKLVELRKKLHHRYAGEKVFSIEEEEIAEPKGIKPKDIHLEDAFLKKVNKIIEKHLTDSKFEIPQLCHELQMSQSQLYRKIKALTGKSIAAYLNNYRLQKGRGLLLNTSKTVAEVAYSVGFTSPSYFSHQYSESFGESPTESRK